nr:hypothetical protein [Asaia platycodi]
MERLGGHDEGMVCVGGAAQSDIIYLHDTLELGAFDADSPDHASRIAQFEHPGIFLAQYTVIGPGIDLEQYRMLVDRGAYDRHIMRRVEGQASQRANGAGTVFHGRIAASQQIHAK